MRSKLDTVDCNQLNAIDSNKILSLAGSTLTQKIYGSSQTWFLKKPSKKFHFSGKYSTLKFILAIFWKCVGGKFRFGARNSGQFLKKSTFSDFLGIKPEINQYPKFIFGSYQNHNKIVPKLPRSYNLWITNFERLPMTPILGRPSEFNHRALLCPDHN